MIRKFERRDTQQIMNIWLNGNTDAHPFIAKEYWISNYPMVKEQLLQAEIYVFEENGEIHGFIGMMDNYIAGIFVDSRNRSRGIGKQLLDYVKKKYDTLSLGVYIQNEKAVRFYQRENFLSAAQKTDEETGETEYRMVWEKNR